MHRHTVYYVSDKLKYAFSFFQDEKLKKLVELHGSEDWKLIASLLSVSSRPVHTHRDRSKHLSIKSCNMRTNQDSFLYFLVLTCWLLVLLESYRCAVPTQVAESSKPRTHQRPMDQRGRPEGKKTAFKDLTNSSLIIKCIKMLLSCKCISHELLTS